MNKSFGDDSKDYFLKGTQSDDKDDRTKDTTPKEITDNFSKELQKTGYTKKRAYAKIIGNVKD